MNAPAEDGGPPLGNMSAPPRSTLTVKPLQLPSAARATGPGRLSNWGLAWYARVDLQHLLASRWPGWGSAPDRLDPARAAHLRLCGAVALLRAGGDPLCHPRELDANGDDRLADELLRMALAPGLPPLLLATRASGAERPMEADPLRALGILTHLSGRTCAPGASPLISEALLQGHTIDLWTPEATHAQP